MKKIRWIFMKLMIVAVVPSLLIPVCMTLNPMKYLDAEAGYYIENKEFQNNPGTYYRVLIMGDSCAKAGWDPNILGDDVYNYALGGAGPIDEYYALENYLEKNKAPQYVVYSMTSWMWFHESSIWYRTSYNHRLDLYDMIDLQMQSMRYSDAEEVLVTNCVLSKYTPYALYLPSIYSTAFWSGVGTDERLTANELSFHLAREDNGHVLYGQREEDDQVSVNITDTFDCNSLLDYYFRRTIELCEAHNITFVFQSPPMKQLTYEASDDIGSYNAEYDAYLLKIEKEYPGIIINREIPVYEIDCFGDVHHVNEHGAREFSGDMRERYPEIFLGGGRRIDDN